MQEDQTLNNAPVAAERRGNQIYVKVTSQLNDEPPDLRVRSNTTGRTAANAVMRSSAIGPPSTTAGLSSATPQLVAPSAFGDSSLAVRCSA